MHTREMDEIIEKLNILEKAYDNIRIVDPVNKLLITVSGNESIVSDMHCFDYWENNKACENCVSMRAYEKKETFIKLEYRKNEIFIVTAIPIEWKERTVIVEMMKNVSNSLSISISDQRKYLDIYTLKGDMNDIAFVDSLTGIYNRRYIDERLSIDMINASLIGQNISIIMADIDFFKIVNDNYGHLAGDCVLEKFAEVLQKCLRRESDWVARYGGEEFLICMPGASLRIAKEFAEVCRQKVENTAILYGESTINITASFGVCSTMPTISSSIDTFIEGADKKLYEAKHNGRNRVEA